VTLVIERALTAAQFQRQRWSNIFTFAYALFAIFIALQIKTAAETATVIYADPVVGITAQYPQGWLLDTSGDYVFRVSDIGAPGFKTSVQVQVLPLGVDITERNMIDNLILRRSQSLASFDALARERITLGEDERQATALIFTYVESEDNPFLESLPTVVEGMDVITTQGGQAIIVTFLSDAQTYEANRPWFQRFLNDLDF